MIWQQWYSSECTRRFDYFCYCSITNNLSLSSDDITMFSVLYSISYVTTQYTLFNHCRYCLIRKMASAVARATPSPFDFKYTSAKLWCCTQISNYLVVPTGQNRKKQTNSVPIKKPCLTLTLSKNLVLYPYTVFAQWMSKVWIIHTCRWCHCWCMYWCVEMSHSFT